MEDQRVILTERDQEILEVLALKVRVLSLSQVASTWWPNSTRPAENARRRLRKLEAQELIHSSAVTSRPVLDLWRPVFAWSPGDLAPDVWKLSYQVESRWTGEPQSMAVFTASRKTAAMLGGVGGELKRPLQVTHDLHLAQIYLHYRRTQPELHQLWVPEDLRGGKNRTKPAPDAVLQTPDGGIMRVVDFIGAYGGRQIEAIHTSCATSEQPYELW